MSLDKKRNPIDDFVNQLSIERTQKQARNELENIIDMQNEIIQRIEKLQSKVSLPVYEVLLESLTYIKRAQSSLSLSDRAIVMENLLWDGNKPRFPKVVV